MKHKLTFLTFLLAISVTTLFAQDTIRTEQTDSTAQAVSAAQTDSTVQVASKEPAAEPKQKSSLKEKLYFGGYVNFSFGKYTMIGIEPMVGYKLTKKLSLGVKIRYDYVSDKRYSEDYNNSNYGGSLFARLRLFKRLYAHVEYAGYNYKHYDELGESDREWIPFLFVGGGFSQSLGKRASLNAQILFDVLQDDNSPFKTVEPFYSVGIGVGF